MVNILSIGSVIVKDVQNINYENINYDMKLEILITKVTIIPTIDYIVQNVSEAIILVYNAHDLHLCSSQHTSASVKDSNDRQ